MSHIDNRRQYLIKLSLLLIVPALFFSCSKADKESPVFEPAASFQEADELIKEGKYEAAREILEEIRGRDASMKYATAARLRIADTYFEDESFEEAAVEYQSFLDMHARHKYSSYAQYKLAMSYFKRIKGIDISYEWAQRALLEFEALLRTYPRNPYRDAAESRIRVCKSVLAEYELYVARFYYKKGSYDAAIERLRGMMQNYPESKFEADALYYLGLSYEKTDQREMAITVLTSLLDKYPTLKISNEAKELLSSFNAVK